MFNETKNHNWSVISKYAYLKELMAGSCVKAGLYIGENRDLGPTAKWE